MLFDWDPNKSAHNSEKHGIDFDGARWLWEDENRVEFRIRVSGEQRYGVLARHGGSRSGLPSPPGAARRFASYP